MQPKPSWGRVVANCSKLKHMFGDWADGGCLSRKLAASRCVLTFVRGQQRLPRLSLKGCVSVSVTCYLMRWISAVQRSWTLHTSHTIVPWQTRRCQLVCSAVTGNRLECVSATFSVCWNSHRDNHEEKKPCIVPASHHRVQGEVGCPWCPAGEPWKQKQKK